MGHRNMVSKGADRVIDGCTIVLDVGKTNAKVSLWDAGGCQLARFNRPNEVGSAVGNRALDVAGIDNFVCESLTEFARNEDVGHIITVGHGAGAALLQNNRLFAPPVDYEQIIDGAEREIYRAERDAFADTGSPFLPLGLNLGLQLHQFEKDFGPLPEDVTIIPWAQYWAWRLCGVAASEISSLGCHTDLWRPMDNLYSKLAIRRGWAARFAPIKSAGHCLGSITPEISKDTGLPLTCKVYCGLHDSNAALLAARGHHEIASQDATVLSTGTWFIAMRSLAPGAIFDSNLLDETRDCLINVDVSGNPVPSARFMGGREAELIGGTDSFAATENHDPSATIKRVPDLIARGAYALPAFVENVGPFPSARGNWINEPVDPVDRRAIAGLYLALMADATLQLIGSRDRLLIEGRFAQTEVFVRALATLRPEQKVYLSDVHNDVAYGALRLICPGLKSPSRLTPVDPLNIDLQEYATQWRRLLAAQSLS